MDQTELFRATVKTLKLRIKKQGAAVSPSDSFPLSNAPHKSTQFGTLAKDVVSTSANTVMNTDTTCQVYAPTCC